ncbi:hypothetical protein OQA88_9028 [Cercophora sp. LCS_1]
MADSDPPAPTGAAAWFPYGKNDETGWRFDVITLLAVIGESSVAVHAQTMTVSTLCLLPRIIPAPQALLRPVRPQRLPEVTAKMAGVYGGVVLDTVGFFANIMHPLEELKPFAFKVLEIKHKDPRAVHGWTPPATVKQRRERFAWLRGLVGRANKDKGKEEMEILPRTTRDRDGNGGNGGRHVTFEETAATLPNGSQDIEMGSAAAATSTGTEGPGGEGLKLRTVSRRPTFSEIIANPATMVNKQERYAVPPAVWSPLHVVSVVSFVFTIGLLVAAGIWEDGAAILAIVLISLASTVTCYASYWRPLLMHRPTTNQVPPGDVVIRTREGAFVLIRCREEVARELYSGTEECQYVSTTYHRVFMGLGMVLLMVAVVLLGNCNWNSQAFIGGTYIFLNGVYWLMGLVPPRYFWDLSRYDVKDITPEDAKDAHIQTNQDPREGAPSFTRTLWFAIRETRHVAWVERSGAMPGTDQWKKWLAEAKDAAWKSDRTWQAVTRKNEIMREGLDAPSSPTSTTEVGIGAAAERRSSSAQTPRPDPAEQVAPLTAIQPLARTATGGL